MAIKILQHWQDYMLIFLAVLFVVLVGWQAYDYFTFRTAGARFTARDGIELCEAQKRIAEYVGYPGELPDCDYATHNTQR